MNDRERDSDELYTCPYLGLASDPSIRCSFLTPSHRCFRWPTPHPVEEKQQDSYCLSPSYQDCPWFASSADSTSLRRGRSASRRTLLSLAVMAFAILMTLVFMRPWPLSSLSASESQPASPTPGPAVPTSTGASSFGSPPPASPAPGSTPRSGAAGPSPAASPAEGRATITPVPSGATLPTSTPTRSPATPVATPPGTQSYVVKEGDNLYNLARSFGVTVEDLMKANGLTDRSYVRVGQRLVIPLRE